MGKALPDHEPGTLASRDRERRGEIYAVKEDLEVIAERVPHSGCRGVNLGLYLGGTQRFAAGQPILIAKERDFEGLRFSGIPAAIAVAVPAQTGDGCSIRDDETVRAHLPSSRAVGEQPLLGTIRQMFDQQRARGRRWLCYGQQLDRRGAQAEVEYRSDRPDFPSSPRAFRW